MVGAVCPMTQIGRAVHLMIVLRFNDYNDMLINFSRYKAVTKE